MLNFTLNLIPKVGHKRHLLLYLIRNINYVRNDTLASKSPKEKLLVSNLWDELLVGYDKTLICKSLTVI